MINYDEVNSIRSGAMSTDDIFRGDDVDRSLTSDLNTIESNITALQTGKANINHTHTNYMSEEDAVGTFALTNHTHSEYAASTHSHPEL